MKQQQRCCRTCSWQHPKWTLSSCSFSAHGLSEAEEVTLAARFAHCLHVSGHSGMQLQLYILPMTIMHTV